MTAEEWNRFHSRGTRVRYREEGHESNTVTVGEAWTLSTGEPVAEIAAFFGTITVTLDCLEPIP